MTDPVADDASDLIAGRSCDGCTMCCKLLDIDVLEKPRGQWCPHCDRKRGCKIYEERPEPCRTFYCGYRRIKDLGEDWKPSNAKFLVNYESAHNRIAIHVDPDRPDVWKREPFHSTIRQWAAHAESEGGTLVVWTGRNVTVVSRTKVFELGAIRDDQFILPVKRMTPRGHELAYIAVDADDPRLKT